MSMATWLLVVPITRPRHRAELVICWVWDHGKSNGQLSAGIWRERGIQSIGTRHQTQPSHAAASLIAHPEWKKGGTNGPPNLFLTTRINVWFFEFIYSVVSFIWQDPGVQSEKNGKETYRWGVAEIQKMSPQQLGDVIKQWSGESRPMGARHGNTAANHTDLQSSCGKTCEN